MISRTAKISTWGGFERIGLTEKEINSIMDELLSHNYKELERIIEFLRKKGYNIKDDTTKVILKILADKQLTSSFTVITNYLDEKIFKMREKARRPFSEKEQKEIKRMVEEGFKMKDKEKGKSLIDKAFEQSQEI